MATIDTNVALFIDYENVHKTLLKRNSNAIRDGFFDRVREWFKDKGRRIVKIAVYCNFDNKDLYESYHQSLLQSYGVETIHTSNQGKNFADLQLTIDVMNAMYLNDNIDEFTKFMDKMIEIGIKIIVLDIDYRDIIDGCFTIPNHYYDIVKYAKETCRKHNMDLGIPPYTTKVLEQGFSTK